MELEFDSSHSDQTAEIVRISAVFLFFCRKNSTLEFHRKKEDSSVPKKKKIEIHSTASVAEAFENFLQSKRAQGLTEKH